MVDTTWDGLPIAADWPNGATVVVRRSDGHMLLLHRAHHGPDFDGDWAWTPPAGARHPGEPILVSALRELAEEAGLTDVPITPVELSTVWGLFAAEVEQDTAVTLVDVEHDQYRWVRPADALAMCRPLVVAGNIRRVLSHPARSIAFRPLHRDDLPSMVTWQAAPHVATGWRDRAATVDAVQTDVVLLDGRAVGFIRMAPLAADPDYLALADYATGGGADAVAIDYAIGEPDLVGRTLGSRMIWGYMRDVVFERRPGTRFVVTDPQAANVAAVRSCEKIGFRRVHEFYPDPERPRHSLYVLDRARVFGPAS
jgi:8-oxo-dGTP pyrophosphatase MutT (NUDIX family)/RimJ/RimL family protein N-acetyltransferase